MKDEGIKSVGNNFARDIAERLREDVAEGVAPILIDKRMALQIARFLEAIPPGDADTKPLPFDLAAAKRGEPLVTRDGRKAFFIGHDAGLSADRCVLARIEGKRGASAFDAHGVKFNMDVHIGDLFMAPKPKRTCWFNIAPSLTEEDVMSAWKHDTEQDARDTAERCKINGYIAVAVPVEIDE